MVNFVHPKDVEKELHDLVEWCSVNEENCGMIDFITVFHYAFVRIHPFEDTNGRTARLLVNLYLKKKGYPPMWIDPSDRDDYIQALAFANFEDDLRPLAKFLGKAMVKCYGQALKDLHE
jgi:Fic family protein